MLVCHCFRVSDRDLQAAAERGATCRKDVEASCRAGSGCGGCGPAIDQILASCRGEGRRAPAGGGVEDEPGIRPLFQEVSRPGGGE